MVDDKLELVIVDDSKVAVEAISQMIDNLPNYKYYKAYSGMECLRLLGNHQIDIILMDVVMEGFDGFETAKVIRANPKYADIPIIFMTALDPDNKMKEQALKLGGIDYLMKPFTESQIHNYLNLYYRFIKREQRINAELNQLNLQLNTEIIQKEKAMKELQDALDIRHKMFAIISHDLKNPIFGFKGLIDEYIKSFDSLDMNDIREVFYILQKSSNQLADMLNDLLTWSNFQRGTISYNPDSIDIHYIAQQIIDQASLQAQNKMIGLRNDVPMDTFVFADPNLVSLTLRNLVSNAIKFTPSNGYVTIFSREDRENSILHISVSDTGVGIPEDILNELFKLNKSRTTLGTNQEKGTGLGLILVKEAIELNRGKLFVETKVGKGTTFTFTLPLIVREISIEL